jgi:hypothetical protein
VKRPRANVSTRLKEISDRKNKRPVKESAVFDLRESIHIPEMMATNDECLLDVSIDGNLAALTEDDKAAKEEELGWVDEPTMNGVAQRMSSINCKENEPVRSMALRGTKSPCSFLKPPSKGHRTSRVLGRRLR